MCLHERSNIHKLISRLKKSEDYTVESIRDVLNFELADLNNDWDLEHYRVRLGEYYGDDESLATAILDAIANTELDFDRVRSVVSNQVTVGDEKLRTVLKLLCKDHYLEHSIEGKYTYYIAIVARWWRISRDLKKER